MHGPTCTFWANLTPFSFEDYSPTAGHLSMMRIALHETLLGKLDDAWHTITLFPGWPAVRRSVGTFPLS
jgi:hypothetical protein